MAKKFAISTQFMGSAGGAIRAARALRMQLGGLAKQSQALRQSWQRTARAGGQLTRNVLGFTAAAGAAVGAGLGVAKAQAAQASALVNNSRLLGISVERYQEFAHGARQASVDIRVMQMAIQRAVRKQGDAANGNKEMAKLFDALGVSIRDANGELKNGDDLLDDLADAFAAIEDPALRVLAAQKLFDSEGVAFVRVLENGRQGIREFGDEAQRLGMVLSESALVGAKSWDEASDALGDSISALARELTTAAAPALMQATQAVQAYLLSNRADIVERFSAGLVEVSGAVKTFIPWARQAAATVDGMVQSVGGWETVLKAVAVIIGAKLLLPVAQLALALGSMGKAAFMVGKALAVLMVANPVMVGVLAAFAAVAAAAYLVIENWEPIKDFFTGLWSTITTGAELAAQAVAGAFRSSMDFVAGLVRGAAASLLESVKGLLSSLPSMALSTLGIDLDSLGQMIADLRAPPAGAGAPAAVAAGGVNRTRTEVVIRGEGLPSGVTLDASRSDADSLTVDVGASFAGAEGGL